MSVFLYQGGFRIVKKSGVGQAILHQQKALEAARIPVTNQYSSDAQIVHINTVFPDSLIKAPWPQSRLLWTLDDGRLSQLLLRFQCSGAVIPPLAAIVLQAGGCDHYSDRLFESDS
jgi:hypothetical protein